jgi:outer membrane receptor protein involved in Fe transport
MASSLFVAMSGAHAQDTGAVAVGEIIVTATKREELLQDVPLAIQAFDTEKLEQLHVSSFDDYVKYLPNVSYQEGGPGFARIFMRGVTAGDVGNHSGPLPSVGVYLDEQPITTIQGPLDIHIYDIARVETLAGPQGTLYGASSQSGTIRIITNKPEVGEFSATYNLGANTVTEGDLGYLAEGMVNVPLGERAALRLVGWYRYDAGYIDNVFGTRTYPTLALCSAAADPRCTGPSTFDNASAVEEDYNDVDTVGARAALRIDLNENWTVTPTLMAQSQDSNGSFGYDPAIGDLKIRHFYPETTTDDWYQAALTVEGRLSDWTLTYAGAYLDREDETDLDYHDYALAYDNVYINYYNDYYAPQGGSAADCVGPAPALPCTLYGEYFFDDNGNLVNPAEYIQGHDWYEKLSQEIRIASPADWRARFVAGLFYQNQKHRIEQRYIVDNLATSLEVTGWPDTWWLTEQEREDEDKAIFGEVTFDFTEKLSGTAGIRFFESENSLKGFFGFGYTNDFTSRTGERRCFGFEYGQPGEPAGPVSPPPSPGGGINGGPCTNLDKTVDDSDQTHKLNLTYRFDDDRLIYATYSTGYRPGGVNRRNEPGFGPYDPDFLDNYELGWKTTWADGTLRWNGAVFWQQWDDFQFSFLGQNGLTNIKNAEGGATIPGVETELEWAATENLTLAGGLMWIKPELDGDFCEETLDRNDVVSAADGGVDGPNEPLSTANCAVFYSASFAPDGTTLPITPEFKANLVARYAYTFGELGGHLQVAAVYTGSSRSALLPSDEQALGGEQDDYTLVDVSASLERGSWTAELYVNNAFDERAEFFRFAQCDEAICGGSTGLGGSTYIVSGPPRMIGLRFGQRFGGAR